MYTENNELNQEPDEFAEHQEHEIHAYDNIPDEYDQQQPSDDGQPDDYDPDDLADNYQEGGQSEVAGNYAFNESIDQKFFHLEVGYNKPQKPDINPDIGYVPPSNNPLAQDEMFFDGHNLMGIIEIDRQVLANSYEITAVNE